MNEIVKLDKKYSYNNLINDIEFLKYYYKKIKTGIIGETTLGRKIFFIKLGNGKEKILIKLTEKANESILSSCIMAIIEEIIIREKINELYKGYDIKEIFGRYTIYFVPMVNPDGVGLVLREKEILLNRKYKNIWKEYYSILELWNNNIRGVDIENNYKKNWEHNSLKLFKKGNIIPNNNTYPGMNYLSEKETINIEKFIKIFKIKKIITIKLEGKRKHLMENKKIKELIEENILEILNVEKCRNIEYENC